MSKFRTLLSNIALFCLVWVLLAGAAEAALRASGQEPPGYVTPQIYGNINLLYRPNSRTRWHGNLGQAIEYDTPITTNSLGQFDREHAVEKPSGTYRVLVVGDSFVEALQVPLEKGFSRLLEDMLNRDPEVARSGRKLEVIKLGGSGYGALREYSLLLNQGLQFKPDLVLAFFTDSNDFKDDWSHFRRQTGQEVYRHVNLRPPAAAYDKIASFNRLLIFPGSWLNRWIAFRVIEWRQKSRNQKQSAADWKDVLGVYAIPGLESGRFNDPAAQAQREEAFRLTLAGHLKMSQEAAGHGAEYAVVLNDRPQTYRPDAYGYLFKLFPGIEKEVDLDLPAKVLKAALKSREIGWLDLNPTFKSRSASGRSGHYRYDGHWNADGHRWTAEALAPLIKSRILHGSKK